MNKIKSIFKNGWLLLAALVMVSSCSDALELEPETTWALDNFYETEGDMDIAFAGIYATLRGLYGQDLMLMDAGTDESYAFKGWVEQSPTNVYTHDETTEDLGDLWRVLYIGINNCNNMITHLDPESFEEEESNRYLAEARFLRAYMYFELTTWWNEVPLRLEPTVDQNSNHVAVSSTEEVYMQIIDDLTFAAEHLPNSFDAEYVAGRANNMAAHAMLARTYLKAGGYPLQATSINDKNPYQAAKEHCEIIMNQGNHALNPDYKELFLNYIQNRYDFSESLFEIVFRNSAALGVSTAGRNGNWNGLLFKPNPRQGTPFGDPEIQPSPIFDLVYEEGDLRKSWNTPGISGVVNNNNPNGRINELAGPLSWGYCIGKFRRWEPIYPDDIPASNASDTPIVTLETPEPLQANNTGINFPLIRFADVLLMFAEAENELNGPGNAIAALDAVRARAGLDGIATVRPEVTTDPELFFMELVDERLRELCFEGNRKADLVRWYLLEDKLEEFEASVIFNPGYLPANHTYKLRSVNNFDPTKHYSLPYPQQEVLINNLMEQKPEW